MTGIDVRVQGPQGVKQASGLDARYAARWLAAEGLSTGEAAAAVAQAVAYGLFNGTIRGIDVGVEAL